MNSVEGIERDTGEMKGRKGILAFLSLFSLSVLFILLSGLLQLRTEEKEMLQLLKGEAMLLSKYVEDEVEWQLGLVETLSRHPSLLLPQMMDLASLDEEIVAEIHEAIVRQNPSVPEDILAEKMAIYDKEGKRLGGRGDIEITDSFLKTLLKEGTFAKVSEESLITGVRIGERFVFLEMGKAELDELRKRHLLKSIVQRVGEGTNVTGVMLYTPQGTLLASKKKDGGKTISFRVPFESPMLSGYAMDVLFPVTSLLAVKSKTTKVFVVLLCIFLLSGGFFTYLMLRMQARHEKEIREMERKIAYEERLISQGRLASGVAHEIRNPLNAIGLSVERLKREFQPRERQEEYVRFLDAIRSEVARIGRVVEELMFSTRPLPSGVEDMKHLIDEVVLALKEKADERRVKIENLVEADLKVLCQKEKMKQVFFNLIENGIEAITGGGTITIESKRRAERVEIHVRDTGEGIKKEHIGRIFEHYFTTKKKGMGLGLPIAYMIVKEHGGEIVLASEEGKGSVFTVILPWKG